MKLRKRVKDLEDKVDLLQYQIKCGNEGHCFVLNSVRNFGTGVSGYFQCNNCLLRITRKLTNQEKIAAKKLGFLK